jgi:hypothetical protein
MQTKPEGSIQFHPRKPTANRTGAAPPCPQRRQRQQQHQRAQPHHDAEGIEHGLTGGRSCRGTLVSGWIVPVIECVRMRLPSTGTFTS